MLTNNERGMIGRIIEDLQQMTSGNVSHRRDGIIGLLRSLVVLSDERAAQAGGAPAEQTGNNAMDAVCTHRAVCDYYKKATLFDDVVKQQRRRE